MVDQLPSKISLEIVTPERQLFSGDVDEVSVPGITGYLGVLPGHAPLLSELKIGVISYRIGSDITLLACTWGFVEVLPDRVSILAENAATASEIDLERASRELDEAEEGLKSKAPETDFQLEMERWEKAMAQLEVGKKMIP